MPTYDYECTKCPHTFEAFQSMSAAPLTKCPKCGGKVKRLIGTGAGILFKGKGFYQTDYRSSAYVSSAKADHAPAKTSSSTSTSTSDASAKPAASTTAAAAPKSGVGAKSAGATGASKK
jgi:putative FmdB family regulatory protein